MPSPSRTSDGKKHSVSGSDKVGELGSSDFRRKSLKREDGAKEWTGKPSELYGRVEPVLDYLHIKKKTMNGRMYKSMIKLQVEKDKIPVSSGVSTGTGSQSRPREAYNVSEGGTASHDAQQNVHVLPRPQIMKLCQTLRLPEDVRVMVGRFLEYVTGKHDVNWEPKTKLEAFQLSLCWNSASLMKYKIDKKETLLLAKQHLHFRCSVGEVSNAYTELRKLRKSFEVDLGNVKELDSTKHCISACSDRKEDKKRLPLYPIEGKELLRCNKKVERKLEKRMKKLAGKQQKEIDEFHRIWGQQKVQLLEQHRQRAALVSSSHSNKLVKLNELKDLDEELAQKMEEHKYQRETSLKDLKAQHLAKKSKVIGKKPRWLQELKSSRQVEQSYIIPCDETGSRYPSETPTVCQSVNHETVSIDSMLFHRAPIDGCGQLSGLHGSVNASENNTIAKLPSSEEELSIRPLSSGEEVTESIEKVLSGGLHGSGNDSGNNIIAKPPCSGKQLPKKPPSNVGEVVKILGNGVIDGLHGSFVASENYFSQNNFIMQLPASQVQIPLGVSPNVEEVIERDGNELAGGLQGSGNASQDASMKKKFPLQNCQSPPCAQMANAEEPTERVNEQLSTEAVASDEIVHELVSTNPSQQLQQPPSAVIPLDTNQPTSPSHCSDHGFILENPSGHQLLSPSAIISVDTSRPTASIVEQAPHSEDFSVSINTEALQESHCPPLHVTNRIHPGPASVVESAPRREIPLVTLNAEPPRQFENSQLPLNRSILGPVCSPTSSRTLVREESPRINQPELRVAITNNYQLVENTPLLSDQVYSRTQLGTPPSITSHMGDLRSHAVLQGARQAAPQITAQRLTSNPLYNEYERLCRESGRVVEVHENMKLHLKSDCEKELAEIRKKYELKLHDAEAAFLAKKKELDINSMKVFMNGLYSQAFQSMAEYKTKIQQDVSSNLMQQVHLPYSEAQPTISPSTFTSSPSILSTCNRQNGPLIGMLTPQRASFQDNVIQARPLHDIRCPLPFSATSFASLPQQTLGHPEPPRVPVYQSVHSTMGPLPTVIGDYLTLEHSYLSRSAFVSNFQSQIATHSSSLLPSVPTSCTNLGLLSPATVGSNGGSRRSNMGNSGEMSGFICLSDDD